MRHLFFSIYCMLAITLITGCTKDDIIPSENGVNPKEGHLTLTVTPSPQTRISIGEKAGDAYPMLWTAGDALGLFSATSGVEINNVQATLSSESAGQNSGIFTTAENVTLADQGA